MPGWSPSFRIYDEDDSLSLLKAILGKDEDKGFLRRSYEEISRVKDLGIGADAPREEIERAGCAPEVYLAYEQALRKTGNVDFGDLILLPLQLLRQNEPEVRERTRQRFRVVLVDEYQDSNVAQFELLKQLWRPGDLPLRGRRRRPVHLPVPRAPRWATSSPSPRSFPGTEIVRLERNYRSTQAILDVASAVVSNNKGRLGKTLWTEKPGGELPVVVCLQDQEEEAEFCARLVAGRFSRHHRHPLPDERAVPALREQVPRERHHASAWSAPSASTAREEVKDALAYLSLLFNAQRRGVASAAS